MSRMSVVRKRGTVLLLGTVALTAPQALAGQEILELPGRDRALHATVQEVFSVGCAAGSSGVTFSIGAGNLRAFEPGLSVGLFPDGSVAVVDSST